CLLRAERRRREPGHRAVGGDGVRSGGRRLGYSWLSLGRARWSGWLAGASTRLRASGLGDLPPARRSDGAYTNGSGGAGARGELRLGARQPPGGVVLRGAVDALRLADDATYRPTSPGRDARQVSGRYAKFVEANMRSAPNTRCASLYRME